MPAISRAAARRRRTWRTLRNGALGASAVLGAHWLLQPALARAAARWGAWPVALVAGGAVVLVCAAFAAWFIGLPQRRARRRSDRAANDYAVPRRRRWLVRALGTLIAAAVVKWTFIQAGDALADRFGFWPGVAITFGVPLAVFALVIMAALRQPAKPPVYGRNTAYVDRALRERR